MPLGIGISHSQSLAGLARGPWDKYANLLGGSIPGWMASAFSRSSGATMFDKDGYIVMAEENLWKYNQSTTYMTAVQGTIAASTDTCPDPEAKVLSYVANSTLTSHYARNEALGLSEKPYDGRPSTFRRYLKPTGGIDSARVYYGFSATDSVEVVFSFGDNPTATITEHGTPHAKASIEKVGDWYLTKITACVSNWPSYTAVMWLRKGGSESFAGDGVDGIQIGAQVVARNSDVPRFVDTNGSASFVSRYDARKPDGRNAGLLLEHDTEKLCFPNMDLGGWSASGGVLVGGRNDLMRGKGAAAFKAGTSATAQYITAPGRLDTVAGTKYVMSIMVRPIHDEWVQLFGTSSSFSSNVWMNFHLSGEGSIGNHGADVLNYGIKKLRDGWYRIFIAGEAATAAAGCAPYLAFTGNTDTTSRLPSVAGDGVSENYEVWGPEFEEGLTPSSFYPTTTTEATRAADILDPNAIWKDGVPATVLMDYERVNDEIGAIALFAQEGAGLRVRISNNISPDRMAFYVSGGLVDNLTGVLGVNLGEAIAFAARVESGNSRIRYATKDGLSTEMSDTDAADYDVDSLRIAYSQPMFLRHFGYAAKPLADEKMDDSLIRVDRSPVIPLTGGIYYFGDSITHQFSNVASLHNFNHTSFVDCFRAAHGNKFRETRPAPNGEFCWGYGGYGIHQKLEDGTVDQIVADARPGDVIVMEFGTNDIAQGRTPQQVADDLKTAYDKMLAAGIVPVVCGIPARFGDDHETGDRVIANQLTSVKCAADGVRFVDLYGALLPENADYYDDGVHPNIFGAMRLGQALADGLKGFGPPVESNDWLPDSENPELAGAVGQGAPTGWNAWNKSPAVTYSDARYEAADDGGPDWLTYDLVNTSSELNGVFRAYQPFIYFPSGVELYGTAEMMFEGVGGLYFFCWVQDDIGSTNSRYDFFSTSDESSTLPGLSVALPNASVRARTPTLVVDESGSPNWLKIFAGIGFKPGGHGILRMRNIGVCRV